MDSFVPGTTLGALEIGVLLSFMLYGVSLTQTYIYYNRFPNDPPKLKALVAVVCVFEGAHAICIGHGLYTYTIIDYGQPERLAYALPKSILIGAFLTAVISTIVQGFFAFRTNIFTRKVYICLTISVMIFCRLVALSAVSFMGTSMTLLVPFENRWGWLVITGLIISVTVDVAIAAILVVSLRIQSRGVRERTTALVDKLIAWTIETALVTSVSTIVTFICFVTMRHNFIWVAVFAVCARLFSNSLLASLNSRAALRQMDQVTVTLPSLPQAIQLPCTGTNIQITKISEVVDDTGRQPGSFEEEV
ncbi:hypothetical protein C8R45DRAFT_536934 [Mycena sanguinolenta]|nr:hypothetical protein C8R45DRAFT_536934 [Mycena sanguinolenta]